MEALLLAVWSPKVFVASRWLSLGLSGTALTAARLAGLTNMLSCASEQYEVSGYHFNGYFRMLDDAWILLVNSATVARSPRIVQVQLFRDNRAALIAPTISRVMPAAVVEVGALSALASVCGMHWRVTSGIRASSLAASLAASSSSARRT